MTITTRIPHVTRLALGALFVAALAGPAGAQCAGDCNADGMVAINELITGVNIALGSAAVSTCPSFDVSGDGTVAINELIQGVNIALGSAPLDNCPVFDTDDDGAVAINEIIAAVNAALNGCTEG